MANPFKILVVDDDETLYKMLVDELSAAGFDVDAAASGEIAVQLIPKKPYDIILLDIKMPGMSGFEVLGFIKKHAPSSKVIMLTAYADVQNAIKSIKLGATDFISKPFDIDGLVASINRTLGA
jgi:DNA-binding response OmpR family regulator